MKIFSPVRIVCLIILLSVSVYSQGTLRGVISDSLTSETLIGANVFLEGTSLGDATNFEGQYNVSNIPAGSYRVKITYIGYRSKEYEVIIKDGEISRLNVTLIPDIIEGEEVIITGQAAGQIAAINQQKSSNTIINVVSEEKIKELPDANAAESIGRLPGVSILRSGGEANKVILRGLADKFTSITIDGIKIPPTDAASRGVDLSMISQNTLAGIELYKALTPDKDGDALAGSVNLVTKGAPEERYIRTDLKGNYNELMNSAAQYDFSLQYGERFFENVLGLQLGGSLERKIRSNERVDVNYTQFLDRTEYWIDDFLLEYTNEIRKRNGISVLLDLRTPDEGSIRFNNVFGNTSRDYLWSTRDYPSTLGGGRNNDGRPTYNYRDREQEIRTYNSSLRGDNYLFDFSVNWGISFAESESYFPYDYELFFTESNGTTSTPAYRSNPELLMNHAVNDFGNSPLQWAYTRTQDNYDKERAVFLDISRNYNLGDIFSGAFKLGGKYKIKDRSNESTQQSTPYYLGYWQPYEQNVDGSISRKDFTGTYFEDWLNSGGGGIPVSLFYNNETRSIFDEYTLTPLIDREKLREWQRLNKNGIDATGNIRELWENPLTKFNDYNITERVSAAYLMNTLNVGEALTIIAGVRVENEDNDYKAKYMTAASQGFPPDFNLLRDTTSSTKQTVWLPNLNISYRPFDFLNIRAAVYKALARPDFNMRIDRFIAGKPAETGGSFIITIGNPNLKTAQAWNYEINTSFYGNEIGLISLSAYYKEITDMYHMLNNFTTSGDAIMRYFGSRWPNVYSNTLYNLTVPYNSPEPAKVWGFEFEHQINFHFLPGLLKNIVLSYNASIVRSEATLYAMETVSYWDTSGRRPILRSRNDLAQKKYALEGMPEFFGNVSLGYDIGGFSGRISMFHQASHDSSYSASGLGDNASDSFTRFDMSLKQEITNNLAVFLNINNLTDAEDSFTLRSRLHDRSFYNNSERYGRSAEFGVTLKL